MDVVFLSAHAPVYSLPVPPLDRLSAKVLGKMKDCRSQAGPVPLDQDPQANRRPGSSNQAGQAEEESDEGSRMATGLEGAGKYLLSGGIAGAVSRTATAPFDRLKVYLITSQCPVRLAGPGLAAAPAGASHLWISLKLIYNEHSTCNHSRPRWGMRNFFIGNGLNVLKVFPESALKFFVYEYAKRLFSQHPSWTGHSSKLDRSYRARFVAGGIAGVVSQVVIYPIETLKTQLMSSTTNERFRGRALLVHTIRQLNEAGGIRAYYKGLVAAMVGVFPYSAIDMSAFEALKKAYRTASGKEAGVAATLACGAASGGVGASVVYPLNVVRTRLQAQGTPYHPQRYAGVADCVQRTFSGEGWRGFYKGLAPSLLKVVPAVSISWLVYERSNSFLDSFIS